MGDLLGGGRPLARAAARMLLAANHAMRAGVQAVDWVFRLAGAEAVYADHPVQRCPRDIHTADQHILFSSDRDKRYTRLRLRIEQAKFMI